MPMMYDHRKIRDYESPSKKETDTGLLITLGLLTWVIIIYLFVITYW